MEPAVIAGPTDIRFGGLSGSNPLISPVVTVETEKAGRLLTAITNIPGLTAIVA